MKGRIANIVSLALAVLLAAGVMTVFSACSIKDDGTWMHCHDAQMYVCYLAVAMAAVSLIATFMKNAKAVIALDVVQAALAGVAIAIPGGIVSMCMMDTMRCWAVMKPFATIMSALILVAAIAGIIMSARSLSKRPNRSL